MTHKQIIEARLERSLANQVRAPRLDRRFDSAVWARIEAEEQAREQTMVPAAHRVATATSNVARWMLVTNVIGFAVASLLVLYFGLRMFNVGDLEVSLSSVAVVPSEQMASLIAGAVSVAAVAFGLMFTPIGRRLRAEFS